MTIVNDLKRMLPSKETAAPAKSKPKTLNHRMMMIVDGLANRIEDYMEKAKYIDEDIIKACNSTAPKGADGKAIYKVSKNGPVKFSYRKSERNKTQILVDISLKVTMSKGGDQSTFRKAVAKLATDVGYHDYKPNVQFVEGVAIIKTGYVIFDA